MSYNGGLMIASINDKLYITGSLYQITTASLYQITTASLYQITTASLYQIKGTYEQGHHKHINLFAYNSPPLFGYLTMSYFIAITPTASKKRFAYKIYRQITGH